MFDNGRLHGNGGTAGAGSVLGNAEGADIANGILNDVAPVAKARRARSSGTCFLLVDGSLMAMLSYLFFF